MPSRATKNRATSPFMTLPERDETVSRGNGRDGDERGKRKKERGEEEEKVEVMENSRERVMMDGRREKRRGERR